MHSFLIFCKYHLILSGKIEIRDPEMPPEIEEGKFSRMDPVLDIDGVSVNVGNTNQQTG